ncbi:uncharacterized SAM-binding protein YcdF (DUF218 family) [Ereboglobus sp. PH5-10]|uniref:ArnT family glycosyltransferase n=1 Tax=Ereboglobus sp. PH5-10 TaxID=2940629 RepID=UPI0024050E93|nr:glycosyltransferase family 39 protein [Ereboglobus sp. PH5-10]MDF9827428.1 uncharacterized SAM-binding protein YcdF (DUF218 family) [Ereboglobus sp. PH5-10]
MNVSTIEPRSCSASEIRNWDTKKWAVAILSMIVFATLLFARLGHYSLWDDETMVALVAKGVVRTGDTSAIIDHGNIVAYENGRLLHNLHDRSTPPLATYITAISFMLFGENAWAARAPFALFGLATLALVLYWARRQNIIIFSLLAIGIVCNVALLLQFKQCRYYAVTVFFSVLVAYLYYYWGGDRRKLILMALASICLFTANYLNCIVMQCCLLIDYIFWKRHEHTLGFRDWLALLLPQAVVCGMIALIWNPMKTAQGNLADGNTFFDRITLIYWNFRDLNVCEFYTWVVLVFALVIGIMRKKTWLLRASTALVAYVIVLSFLSPQNLHGTSAADVRYFGPLVPLSIALGIGVIHGIMLKWSRPALIAGAILFSTNIISGHFFQRPSTIYSYIGELRTPPEEPFKPTSEWINKNIPEGKTVFVAPNYAAYPLMFHAPKATYAWQLNDRLQKQYINLKPPLIKGEEMPDYLIGFGPYVNELKYNLQKYGDPNARYQIVEKIDVFWKDMYRPELFWRTFKSIKNYSKGQDEVIIFKRIQ